MGECELNIKIVVLISAKLTRARIRPTATGFVVPLAAKQVNYILNLFVTERKTLHVMTYNIHFPMKRESMYVFIRSDVIKGYHPLKSKEKKDKKCKILLPCCISFAVVLIILFINLFLFYPWLFKPCAFFLRETPSVIEGYMPKRISFSSCMGNWKDHALMNNINSDLHIFLGDSIYGDDYNYEFEAVKPQWLSFFKLPTHLVQYYEAMYRKLSCRRSFQNLLRRTIFVLSIWDDHDYGADDETSANPMKETSKKMFCSFWKLNNERQNVKGVYGSYEFKESNVSLLIILPDIHFTTTSKRLFDPEQWGWLVGLLGQHNHSKVIMGMSSPITALRAKYTSEIDTLLTMMDNSNSVIISGDPHVPSIVRFPSGHTEITSSPLAMVGTARPEFTFCSDNCTVINNQDNYGLIDLRERVGMISSKQGVILKTQIFK